jgi:hypothetical protein
VLNQRVAFGRPSDLPSSLGSPAAFSLYFRRSTPGASRAVRALVGVRHSNGLRSVCPPCSIVTDVQDLSECAGQGSNRHSVLQVESGRLGSIVVRDASFHPHRLGASRTGRAWEVPSDARVVTW